MDSMEEDDVYILDYSHWLLRNHADSRVHLPIS